MLKSYQELKVWEKAYQLCSKIYALVKNFPVEKRYGLSLQLRRSAVSIPANIAEGYGRKTRGEYVHHLLDSGTLRTRASLHAVLVRPASLYGTVGLRAQEMPSALRPVRKLLYRDLRGLIALLRSRFHRTRESMQHTRPNLFHRLPPARDLSALQKNL